MRSKHVAWMGGLAVALLSVASMEREAAACGGCFAPQENPTVVTDHRMVMTITKNESTLYDQIRYQGDPKSFAWVLPYSGEITVGLSSDVVFSALDQTTQTTILPPPGCGGFSSSGGSSGTSAGSGGSGDNSSGGVTVIKREVVGPYETVQLKATEPKALETWLQTNGFNVPADVQPVIATYVGERFNFLALKLIPTKGIQDMRPVRVTTKGASTTLPLRMVAAGTGATVGISLWVIGEGRYEPQNFGSFIIDDNDLGWDPNSQRSNYTEVRKTLTEKGGGGAWEIESSIFLSSQVTSIITQGTAPYTGGTPQSQEERAAVDYTPIKDAAGNVTKTAVAAREEDIELLFPNDQATRVTRLRADLVHAALTQDLTLRASADQGYLTNTRQLTRCGFPGDPSSSVITPGRSSGAIPAPVTNAGTNGGSSDGTFTCATSSGGSGPWGTIALGAFAVVVARTVRRRRSS